MKRERSDLLMFPESSNRTKYPYVAQVLIWASIIKIWGKIVARRSILHEGKGQVFKPISSPSQSADHPRLFL
jgi:hypothetical protein